MVLCEIPWIIANSRVCTRLSSFGGTNNETLLTRLLRDPMARHLTVRVACKNQQHRNYNNVILKGIARRQARKKEKRRKSKVQKKKKKKKRKMANDVRQPHGRAISEMPALHACSNSAKSMLR